MATAQPPPPDARRPAFRAVALQAGRVIGGATLAAIVGVLALASAPGLFGMQTFIVNGGSMGDAAPVGSLAFGRSVAASAVRPGDVIVFADESPRGDARRVLHRVVGVADEAGVRFATTRGDANPVADARPHQLADRTFTMSFAVPLVGYFLAVLASDVGWALGVVVPVSFLAVLVLARLWKPELAAWRATPGHLA